MANGRVFMETSVFRSGETLQLGCASNLFVAPSVKPDDPRGSDP